MRHRDFADDRQAEPGSVRPAGYKRLEQVIANSWRRPGPLVMNRENQAFGVMARGKQDTTAGRGRLYCIEDQVVESAAHLFGVEAGSLCIRSTRERDSSRSRKFVMCSNAGL